MMGMIRLALRNALRNGRRTFLTAATVTIGTAFTVFILALLIGVFDGMIGAATQGSGLMRVTTTAFADKESLNPLHENIPEVAPLLEQIRGAEGIVDAEPRITTGVLLSNTEELGEDPALLVGSTQAWYDEYVLDRAILTGDWVSPDDDGEQVVIGARIARDLGAKVGEELLVMGSTQYGSMAPISPTIVGVVTGDSDIDGQVFVTLQTAQWLADIPDGALEVLVYTDHDDDDTVAAATQTLQAALGDEFLVRPWYDTPIWAQAKPIIDVMQFVLSAMVIFIMALAIFNTMTMSVLERTGEIGVLRAMGQSRLAAVTSFLTEATLIGVVGGILGAALGALPALYFEQNGYSMGQEVLDEMSNTGYAMGTTLYADLTPALVVGSVVIGALTAILGALFPAIRAARIEPYEAMRARR